MLYELSVKNKGKWKLLDCSFSKKEMQDKLQDKVIAEMEATGVNKMEYRIIQCGMQREQIEEGFVCDDTWFDEYFKNNSDSYITCD